MWNLSFRVVVVSTAFSLWALSSNADGLDQWFRRNPRPLCSQVYCLTHGGGLSIAGSSPGMVATSPNGIDWDLANLGTNSVVFDVAFGNGLYVAASSRGVYVSRDAHAWSRTFSTSLNDVGFGNGRFFGVNFSGTVYESLDGTNWFSLNVGGASQYSTVSFANNHFFLLGTDGTSGQNGVANMSGNGTNWLSNTNGNLNLGSNGVQKVVYGNGVYVGMYGSVTAQLYSQFRTSVSGTNWSAPIVFTNALVVDLVFANGKFYALDEVGGMFISPDGTSWTEQIEPELFAMTKLDFVNGTFLTMGIRGITMTSPDALTWTIRSTGAPNSIVGMLHRPGLYLAVGGNVTPDNSDSLSSPTIATSVDGRDWVAHDPGTTNAMIGVAYGGGTYVAVGAAGTIVTSVDGTNWTGQASPTTNQLNSVAYGMGMFVAVGGTTTSQEILTSPDGATWTTRLAGSGGGLYGVTFAQNQFVAVGITNSFHRAAIEVSTDGLNWFGILPPTTNSLRSVTYGNGKYLAVGDRATVEYSADGTNWLDLTMTPARVLKGVAFGNGSFVAVGLSGAVLTSQDGLTWTLRTNVFNNATVSGLYTAVCGDTSFFVGGFYGLILESMPFTTVTPSLGLELKSTVPGFLWMTGTEGHAYEIDSTDSLSNAWAPLTTITNYSATTILPVSAITNATSARFYRGKLLN